MNRTVNEADHSLPHSVEIFMEWCLISKVSVFVEWYFVKHRDNFTFTLKIN